MTTTADDVGASDTPMTTPIWDASGICGLELNQALDAIQVTSLYI